MMPEHGSDALRALLRSVPVPPIRTDVDRAVYDGRRGVRLRRYGATGAAALAVVLAAGGTVVALGSADRPPSGGVVTSPTAAPPAPPATSSAPAPERPSTEPSTDPAMLTCTTTVLRGTRATVRAADPSGRYVVADNGRSVRYDNGVPATLPLPPGATTVETNAVNGQGEVVGMALTGSGAQFAWAYRRGTAVRLPQLAGYPLSAAYGINARGDIAGIAWNDRTQAAVVWPAASQGSVRRLTASSSAAAYDIADDGTVVGGLGDGNGPYLWDSAGTGRRLPVPAGTSGGKAFAVSGDWAVGWASPGGGDAQLAVWNLATGTVTAGPGLAGDAMSTVNAAGDVIAGSTGSERYLLRDGRRYTVPVSAPYTSAELLTISADGTVFAGNLTGPAGAAGAVWRC